MIYQTIDVSRLPKLVLWERGKYRIQTYLSFIQHRSIEILCGAVVTILSYLKPDLGFNIPN